MSAPTPSRLLLAILLAWALATSSLARAQVVTLAEPVAVADDLATVFEKGSRLERERRWAEALTHYEDALRAHPARADLQQRVQVARAHYDVVRRYGDASFTKAVATLAERDALAIHDEVLLKIHGNYVHNPRWQQLLYSGLTNLEVALTEPAFLEKNLPNLPAERLVDLQRDLRQMVQARPADERQQALNLVQSIALSLKQTYGLPPQATILEFTSGATAALDEYSGFLTGSQMDEVFSQIEGNFVGLGVELKTEPAGLLIVSVITGGPAYMGGLRAGERILAVDGKTTAEVSPDTLADMLRGNENTQVEVLAQNSAGERRQMRLTRRRVEVPSVEDVKMLDREIGVAYFKLTSFQKSTSRDVDAALWKLHEQGMRHLVIDLRGNPGGLLKASVDVADKFVMDGLLVATRGRSPREDFDHRGQVAGTWRVPLVVLIDHDSASASEIFAGAIRDHRRGTVVGEKSYGKGSVQGIFPLAAANVGIRLTTAKWYTPSGQAISGAGVNPDIVVQVTNKPVDGARHLPATEDDPFIRAGLAAARNQQTARRP
ncbi:MAG: S41 family peptidase [Pirellulaceae bacterium]|nr:S41 family peptidase [Pirellulaceae bacterium]